MGQACIRWGLGLDRSIGDSVVRSFQLASRRVECEHPCEQLRGRKFNPGLPRDWRNIIHYTTADCARSLYFCCMHISDDLPVHVLPLGLCLRACAFVCAGRPSLVLRSGVRVGEHARKLALVVTNIQERSALAAGVAWDLLFCEVCCESLCSHDFACE